MMRENTEKDPYRLWSSFLPTIDGMCLLLNDTQAELGISSATSTHSHPARWMVPA
jgi:hypothetical protein